MPQPEPLHPIRTIDVGRFRVNVDAVPDDVSTEEVLRGTAHEGDEEILQKCRDARLVHFAVRAAVLYFPEPADRYTEGASVSTAERADNSYRWTGEIELASTSLGGCIYDSYEAFAGSPYLQDLVTEAVQEAREVFKRTEVRALYAATGKASLQNYGPYPLPYAIDKARDYATDVMCESVAVFAPDSNRRLWAPRTPRPTDVGRFRS